MALFGKKKQAGAGTGAPNDVPTEKVIQMRQQGTSNDQIISQLQEAGYNSSQIFDAMSQADIKSAAGGEPVQGMQMQQQFQEGQMQQPMPSSMPPSPTQGMQGQEDVGTAETAGPSYDMPPRQPLPSGEEMPLSSMPPPPMPLGQEEMMPQPGFQQPLSGAGIDRSVVEEVAESIIDEKWEDLMKSVDKIIEWKDATDTRISKMEQNMKNLKERFDSLHQGVLARVSEYDKGIREVGTDIKAMEEVFKKVLPTFTANVNELSRMTKNIKAPKRSKSKSAKKK